MEQRSSANSKNLIIKSMNTSSSSDLINNNNFSEEDLSEINVMNKVN